MRICFAGLWLATVVLITGCASTQQTSVELQAGALREKGLRIGVVMTAIPKPDTYFPGAGCLLCMATASLANSSLTNQVRTWQTKDLEALRGDLAAKLRDRGLDVVVIAQDIDIVPFSINSQTRRATGYSNLLRQQAIIRACNPNRWRSLFQF